MRNRNTLARTRLLDELESELIERARRGDTAAFEELVRRYQKLAFRVAYVIVGSATEAEDAIQEAFVRAYRAINRFRAGSPVRPWLLTIVANAARSRRAVTARHPTLTLDAAADLPGNEATESPEIAALTAERRRELLSAVQDLREDDQQVIACRYFLDLSEAETAGVLGCARGTVKSRHSRALARLRLGLMSAAASGGRLDV